MVGEVRQLGRPDAVLTGERQWTLSTLLRGLGASEALASRSLAPGAPVVIVNAEPTGMDHLARVVVSGSISDDDKAYLAQLVAANTGLSADDAKKRVDAVLANVDAAKQKALDAAETARKTSVLAAFLIAASLLVAAAAAYWAAMLGGNHRDDQIVFENWTRR